MKKHFSSILILMLLALGGHAQMSMYGASGDFVQLSATGEVVLEDGGLTVGIGQSGYSIDALVSNNNNVARRNITVRQYYPVLPPGPINFGIAPNPASSVATISYELPEGTTQATLAIMSLDGQVYRTVSVDATAVDATGSIPVDVQGLPSGQYQVILSAGAYAESKTLIVY